ncbi:LLM class flavin-dependent oxidoreductase [Actinophytocola sediminis]
MSERSVEFISQAYVNSGNEIRPGADKALDRTFFARYVRTLDEYGFDYVLLPYGSARHDPITLAAAVAATTERLTPIVALRPNLVQPTWAAKALATIDQLGGGRAAVHIISGGDDHEQRREGDRLDKARRYARSAEFIQLLRRVWTADGPIDHAGEYYSFEDFASQVRPTRGTIPISVGGSSPEAYRVGGAHGDIFGLWGEPLDRTREQIAAITAEATAAGRAEPPRIWATFRPIIDRTEELAWDKAHRTLAALNRNAANGGAAPRESAPNAGSQRLLDIAKQGERHDRALWTPVATATGARGASTALVGTPETVAAALLDYVDLGVSLISIRGYDYYDDAVDYGRHLLPLVHQELATRRALTGSGAR